MSLSHREEEIVKIVTPIALELVNQHSRKPGNDLSDREKTKAVAETMDQIIDDLEGKNLNVSCNGPYCEICGMCAF